MKKQLLFLLLLSLVSLTPHRTNAQSKDIPGPTGSGQFGHSVTVLPNGNYVVTDPYYDEGGKADIGAVYLYNGKTHAQISKLTGSTAGDQVGIKGITILANGNYVIGSDIWYNGTIRGAGAVTWADASIGVNGVVSGSNSLVGSSSDAHIGSFGIVTLTNGNYVVPNPYWDNGSVADVGAVTWGSGTTGITGTVNSANSLIGANAYDRIGAPSTIESQGIIALSNGNYLISSPRWDNETRPDAGAVTWASGISGISGIVSSTNSLVGTKAYDRLGDFKIAVLPSGNYVIVSPYWNNYRGAVTWGNGDTGIIGEISSSNSLVGTTDQDQVGYGNIIVLSNGNYVVRSTDWDNGGVVNVGAVTWGNGTSGVSGTISSSNSLIGIKTNDFVGIGGVLALSNGNYAVQSPSWNNGALEAVGAVTWGNGTTGTVGEVKGSNSLIGSTAGNAVGLFATSLLNGNYVIGSPLWDNGSKVDVGAVTWANGASAISGFVNSNNSLIGTSTNDRVGDRILPLQNGNYVVGSTDWDNGGLENAGAVTWGDGATGLIGEINSSNSLVGTKSYQRLGNSITALTNGNYVIQNPDVDNGTTVYVGAVTWGDGSKGISGTISIANSLVGAKEGDVGGHAIFALSNGNYLVRSTNWDNGTISNVGAVTWANGTTESTGTIGSHNSLIGLVPNDEFGKGNIIELSNGDYLIFRRVWSSSYSSYINAKSVTLGSGITGVSGLISKCNSVFDVGVNPYFYGDYINAAFDSTYNYIIVGLPKENKLTIFTPTGMNMSTTLDETTVDISGEGSVPLVANANCKIIANLVTSGGNPVQGVVHAKTWVEGTVPSYGGQPFVARHYEITPDDDAANATGRLTLYFTQEEFDDFNDHSGSLLNFPGNGSDAAGKSHLRIGKFSGISSTGTGLPDSYDDDAVIINPDDDDIVWNEEFSRWEISFDVEGFSGFVVQTEFDPLPVRLISFKGKSQENNALLEWEIADAKLFESVGEVKLTSEKTSYNYIDADAARFTNEKERVYYRLKLVDLDGTFAYSKMAELTFSGGGTDNYVYPNPFTSSLAVAIKNHNGENVTVDLRNQSGELLLSRKVSVAQDKLDFEIGKTKLATGTYILTIHSVSEVINLKVVKE
jgi:hypothetical protein